MVQKPYTIRWAGLDLPGDTDSHFGIVGAGGGGKTLALQALMRSVIPTVRDLRPAATARRALVFDPKNNFIPFLQELAGVEYVHVLNPFDMRSRPWDLANEIESLPAAQEMASIFIAEQQGDMQPFWQRTTRWVLSSVFNALLLKAPGRWTLRHVFHIVTNEPRLTAVLKAANQMQLVELLQPTPNTFFNVLAALHVSLNRVETVAALWDSSVRILGAKPFTLKAWLSGHGVLVFGQPTELQDDMLGRAIFTRASQLIRAQLPKDHASGETWIFLDDLPSLGNLPGVDEFLHAARNRSTRVVITLNEIDGLRGIYGEQIAEKITNQCDTMSYLRCSGTTAKWAAERIGRSEYWSSDDNSGSSSPYMIEAELSGLPPVAKHVYDGKPGGYIQGWHVVPAIESVFRLCDKDAWYAFENMNDAERFNARPQEHQVLRPWDDATDWDELGFRP